MVDYLFLHGGGQGSWVWDDTIAAMGQQSGGTFGRAIGLDIPGCGAKRDRDTASLGVEAVVAELAAELDAANVKDAVLVGHSQAGTILPGLLAARPALFRRVVYVSCCAPLPGQSVGAMMGASRHGENPAEVGWPLDPATHAIPQQFAAMFCNDMSPDEAGRFLERLGRDAWPGPVSGATEWIYGRTPAIAATYVVCMRDASLPPGWQMRFAERFGAARLVHIDAGHQVMNTRPHALAEVLRLEASA